MVTFFWNDPTLLLAFQKKAIYNIKKLNIISNDKGVVLLPTDFQRACGWCKQASR